MGGACDVGPHGSASVTGAALRHTSRQASGQLTMPSWRLQYVLPTFEMTDFSPGAKVLFWSPAFMAYGISWCGCVFRC